MSRTGRQSAARAPGGVRRRLPAQVPQVATLAVATVEGQAPHTGVGGEPGGDRGEGAEEEEAHREHTGEGRGHHTEPAVCMCLREEVVNLSE